jgi:hypothetical protein
MKITVAIALGFLSGFLAYMAVAMLSASSARGDLTALVPAFLTFGVVWIVSAWWMRRGAKRIHSMPARVSLGSR